MGRKGQGMVKRSQKASGSALLLCKPKHHYGGPSTKVCARSVTGSWCKTAEHEQKLPALPSAVRARDVQLVRSQTEDGEQLCCGTQDKAAWFCIPAHAQHLLLKPAVFPPLPLGGGNVTEHSHYLITLPISFTSVSSRTMNHHYLYFQEFSTQSLHHSAVGQA